MLDPFGVLGECTDEVVLAKEIVSFGLQLFHERSRGGIRGHGEEVWEEGALQSTWIICRPYFVASPLTVEWTRSTRV